MKASEHYRRGRINVINQRWNPDGTVEVVIYRHGWNKPYKFKAKDLGFAEEKILEDEEVKEKVEEE